MISDRDQGQRLHMLSAAGALDADFRTAVTDYGQLGRLAGLVCGGDLSQVRRLAPGYDLTWSPHPSVQRATLVAGEGRRVERRHFEALATDLGLRTRERERLHDQVLEAVARVGEHLEEAGCRGTVSVAARDSVLEAVQALR